MTSVMQSPHFRFGERTSVRAVIHGHVSRSRARAFRHTSSHAGGASWFLMNRLSRR